MSLGVAQDHGFPSPKSRKRGDPLTPRAAENTLTFQEARDRLCEIPMLCLGYVRARCDAVIVEHNVNWAKATMRDDADKLQLEEIKLLVQMVLCKECREHKAHLPADNVAKRWLEGTRHNIMHLRWDQKCISLGFTSMTSDAIPSTVPTSPITSLADEPAPPPDSPSLRTAAERSGVSELHLYEAAASDMDRRMQDVSPNEQTMQAHEDDSDRHDSSTTVDSIAVGIEETMLISTVQVQVEADDPFPFLPPESSNDGCFRPGRARRWTPSMIIQRVEEIMHDELIDKSYGSLYAFRDETRCYVKIGYTTQARLARMAQIRKSSGIALDQDSWKCYERIPLGQLLKLERLIHADLAYTNVLRGSRPRVQHEWFKIDWEDAENCIDYWHDVVTRSAQWPPNLNEMPVDSYLKVQDTNEAEVRRRNDDHKARLYYWKKRLSIIRKRTFQDAVRWLTVSCAIGLLPWLFRVPDIFKWPMAMAGLALWTQSCAFFK